MTKEGFEVENPITHARAKFELDQHAPPAVQALADELAALRGKLDDMEQQIALNRELVNVQLGIPPMGVRTHASWINQNRLLETGIRQDIEQAIELTKRSNE